MFANDNSVAGEQAVISVNCRIVGNRKVIRSLTHSVGKGHTRITGRHKLLQLLARPNLQTAFRIAEAILAIRTGQRRLPDASPDA